MTNQPPASLVAATKLKARRFRTEADIASANVTTCQEEITQLTYELRQLVTRRDELLKNRSALTQAFAKPGDSRLDYIDQQLAPLHSEIALIEGGLVDVKTRQAAMQQSARPLFRLANAAEQIVRDLQGQPHTAQFIDRSAP